GVLLATSLQGSILAYHRAWRSRTASAFAAYHALGVSASHVLHLDRSPSRLDLSRLNAVRGNPRSQPRQYFIGSNSNSSCSYPPATVPTYSPPLSQSPSTCTRIPRVTA